MATPKAAVDNTDFVEEAVMDKVYHNGGAGGAPKIIGARVRYNGTAWEIEANTYSAQLIAGNLAWDTDHLEITVSGFTNEPLVTWSQVNTTNRRFLQCEAVSTTQIDVYFFTLADVADTTESTDMDFYVFICGD